MNEVQVHLCLEFQYNRWEATQFGYRRSEMITSLSGSNDHVEYDNVTVADSGDWFVESFINENSAYVVFVDEDKVVQSCTCFYFKRNQSNCKHMHLLCIQVNEFSLPTFAPLNRLPLLIEDTTVASGSNLFESDIPASSSPPLPSTSSLLSRASDYISMMYHIRNDLISMSYIDTEEAENILEQCEKSFRMIQEVKDKYSSHFRTLSTQR